MPRKPKADVPKLTFHKSLGQWCKTFTLPSGKRKTVYFGTEPNAAMQKYLAEREEWQAGRNPRKVEDAPTEAALATPTLAYVVNSFLERSEARVEAGDISPVTFRDYREVGKQMVAHFGRDVEAEKLRPADFARFRFSLAKRYAPSRLSKTIIVSRMMLTWAFKSELLDNLPRFGPDFAVASKRKERDNKEARGEKYIEPKELRDIMDHAKQPLKAMLLLAANCAYGNTDLANLPLSAVDLDGGWITFPRPKTGIPRRCPLWSETVASLREVISDRKPRDEFAQLVFVTRRGGPFIGMKPDGHRVDKIIEKFREAAKAAGVHRPGMGLYWIRHSWRTAVDECHDQAAIDRVMGHVRPGMSAEYVERIDDARLRIVSELAYRWLGLGDDAEGEPDTIPMRGAAG